MKPFPFTAVIFDLDGVITRTALVHSSAWKLMFDNYLHERESIHGEVFKEFSHEQDYLKYIDGKPRYDGVRSFLESRGIKLPYGNPGDSVSVESICGLGNRKNEAFNEVLDKEGVQVFESTIRFMKELRKAGIRIGVASSSRNCRAVLEKAGLTDLVETFVDGVISAETGLKGKPEPDIFLQACKNLAAEPAEAVVVEDATSGIEAGYKGNFALVIGIARENNRQELLIHGADIVCEDMDEINLQVLMDWFTQGLAEDNWTISYHSYEPLKERAREALLTIGNGYVGTRGALEECDANEVNYPGTYIAGLYNRLLTEIAGRTIENEDFVNCPNWLPLTFRVEDGDWFSVSNTEIISFRRQLQLKTGLYSRELVCRDQQGRETKIMSERFISMNDCHLGGMCYSIQPLNYSGKLTIRSGINGNIINAGVDRYKSLNQQHLRPVTQWVDGNKLFLVVETRRSEIRIVTAIKHSFLSDNQTVDPITSTDLTDGAVYGNYSLELKQGSSFAIEKVVAVYTSKEDDTPGPGKAAVKALSDIQPYDRLLHKSREQWDLLWKNMDIEIIEDRLSQKMVRLHLYHLLVSMSPHNQHIDASITARGLHGEAYRGHVFWDELFILPFYNLNFPEVARSMLMYRYRRLDKAREYAREQGYRGAMFPWQSGSDGREETQVIHLNPLNGQWDPDHSSLQRHVSLAIAYNIWQYWETTGDTEFMKLYGAEMFLEICRFWASKCVFNGHSGRYDIPAVMGPDEFHERYPGAEKAGLTNNAYTNLMVAWILAKLNNPLTGENILLSGEGPGKIQLDKEEIGRWQDISGKLALDISGEGIIAQYQGYFDLKELDWEGYMSRYGDIHRMDRILKAEGLSPDEYKVAKQADTLMIFYNLPKEEVDRLLVQLGYVLPEDYFQKNFDYYYSRTSHGSTLSRIVHAHLASLAGKPELSWKLYTQALTSDYIDIQGGTTGEGIHTGVMAASLVVALKTYAGLTFVGGKPATHPNLPRSWKGMRFGVWYNKKRITFTI